MARILIVEDSPANMTLAKVILEDGGHTPIGACDAEQGIMIASTEPLDLILMDIRLPGMDGLAATRLLKSEQRTRDIPVIAVTASAMMGDEQRIRTAGCVGYVAKPIRYKELLQAIDQVLLPRDAGD